MSEATDEKDLDLAIAVFLEGTHIDKEEEDRNDRVGTYRGVIPLLVVPIRTILTWFDICRGSLTWLAMRS